jgi:hypothetical protein
MPESMTLVCRYIIIFTLSKKYLTLCKNYYTLKACHFEKKVLGRTS